MQRKSIAIDLVANAGILLHLRGCRKSFCLHLVATIQMQLVGIGYDAAWQNLIPDGIGGLSIMWPARLMPAMADR